MGCDLGEEGGLGLETEPMGELSRGILELNGATDEACGPGFWRSHATTAVWGPTGSAPSDDVDSVFSNATPHDQAPLADVLEGGGGAGLANAKLILLRAAVTSFLNAAHPGVAFPLSEATVMTAVDTALASGDRRTILALAGELDDLNSGACPLGAVDDLEAKPDLIVLEVVLDSRVGASITYRSVVKNIGTAPVNINGVVVQGWFSLDADLGSDLAAGGRVLTLADVILQPGDTFLSPPGNQTVPTGYDYLLVEVDFGAVIDELDESNNVGALLLD